MTGLVSLLGVKITFPHIFLVNGVSIRSTKQSELFLFFKEKSQTASVKTFLNFPVHISSFKYINRSGAAAQ